MSFAALNASYELCPHGHAVLGENNRRNQETLRRRLLQRQNSFSRIEAKDVSEREKFHDIDAPLSAFEPGDERLIFAQAIRQIGLGHFGRFSSGDKEVD